MSEGGGVMARSLKEEMERKNFQKALDIDFHDFYQLIEEGFSDKEISRELNVDEGFVKRLKREVEKDW